MLVDLTDLTDLVCPVASVVAEVAAELCGFFCICSLLGSVVINEGEIEFLGPGCVLRSSLTLFHAMWFVNTVCEACFSFRDLTENTSSLGILAPKSPVVSSHQMKSIHHTHPVHHSLLLTVALQSFYSPHKFLH